MKKSEISERTVHLPKATGNEAKEEYVAVNGKAYLIKKGTDVTVPYPVYEVLRNRAKARAQHEAFADEQSERFVSSVCM